MLKRAIMLFLIAQIAHGLTIDVSDHVAPSAYQAGCSVKLTKYPIVAWFDGSARWLSSTNDIFQPATGAFTFTAWVKLLAKIGNHVAVAKDDDLSVPGSQYWLGYELASDKWLFQVIGTDHYLKRSDTYGAPVLSQWTFLVGQYDGSSNVILIVNGVYHSTNTVVLPLNTTNTPFAVGADVAFAGTSGSRMKGLIGPVGYWRRLLTTNECEIIRAIGVIAPFSSIPASVTNNLISYWEMNEASGTRVDSFGDFDLSDTGSTQSAVSEP